MSERLPAHIEVSGLLRSVQAAGGFGMIIKKGERDAGTLLIVCCENGTNARSWERMPLSNGTRGWVKTKVQDPENKQEFWDYCDRRHSQDPDLWVIELDIANGERFIDESLSGS